MVYVEGEEYVKKGITPDPEVKILDPFVETYINNFIADFRQNLFTIVNSFDSQVETINFLSRLPNVFIKSIRREACRVCPSIIVEEGAKTTSETARKFSQQSLRDQIEKALETAPRKKRVRRQHYVVNLDDIEIEIVQRIKNISNDAFLNEFSKNSSFRKAVGTIIAKKRKAMNLSQETFGGQFGLRQFQISRIEKGNRKKPRNLLEVLRWLKENL